MRNLATGLTSFAATTLLAATCVHAEVLDQSFGPDVIPSSFSTRQVGRDDFEIAQTFAAGFSGNLTRIDVAIGRDNVDGTSTGGLVLDVRPIDGGFPENDDATALLVQTIPAVDVPNPNPFASFGTGAWVAVDLGAGLAVQAGEQYALVLRPETPADDLNAFWWLRPVESGFYFNGLAFARQRIDGGALSAWSVPSGGGDMAFRTYVTIPEPAGLSLLALGGLMMLARRRAATTG